MLQFIMDQNLLLYLCGVACALGVVSQFLLRHLYGKLISETQNTNEQAGKFLQQMRQRFHNCTHLNEKVNDISSFTDRSLMDFQFLRMSLHQWRRLGLEALAVCLLSSGLGLWLLYRNGGHISLQTSYVQAAIWSLVLIGIAYGVADNRYRHQSLQTRLMDYLQNTGAVRDYSEVAFPDGIREAAETVAPAGRKLRPGKSEAVETRASRDKRELKENLGKNRSGVQEMAAAKEAVRDNSSEKDKNINLLKQMDPKEKEQILRDVLLEFLT